MAYQALYRKWRPMTFDDVVGQEHITTTLKNEIAASTVKHAYLFCGTRGTGKTSIAKILARAVNCEHREGQNPCNQCETCRGILDGSILDVIEFDAASNSKVEDIRTILDEVNYSAAKTKYKVYIIDEVHMLSNSAFNAILKTLEEPPAHVIFILATTEVQKLPQTIISRCQRFDFKRISKAKLAERFFYILKEEHINCDQDTMDYVCTAADGSVRDGLSILDKVIASCPGDITYEKACRALNIASQASKKNLVQAISKQNIGHILDVLHEVNLSGVSREMFLNDMVSYFRDMLLVKSTQDADAILEYPSDRMASLKELAAHFGTDHLLYAISVLSHTLSEIRYAKNSSALCEVAFIKIARADLDSSEEAIRARLSILEEKLNNAHFRPAAEAAVPFSAEPEMPKQQKKAPFAENEAPAGHVLKETVSSPKSPEKPAVAKEPVKAPKPKKDFSHIASTLDWAGFLKSIQRQNASMFGLLSESKGYLDDKGTLYVVFKDEDAFLKMVVSTPQNMETLTKLVEEKLGVHVAPRTELFSDFAALEIPMPQMSHSPQKEEETLSVSEAEVSADNPEKNFAPEAPKKVKKEDRIEPAEKLLAGLTDIPPEEVPFSLTDEAANTASTDQRLDELAQKFPDIIEEEE